MEPFVKGQLISELAPLFHNCFHQFFLSSILRSPSQTRRLDAKSKCANFDVKFIFLGPKLWVLAQFSIFSLYFSIFFSQKNNLNEKKREKSRLNENWAIIYSFGPTKMNFTSKCAEWNFKFNRLVYGEPRSIEPRKIDEIDFSRSKILIQ